MAYVSFTAEGRSTYGIARPDGVFDLGRHIGAAFPDLRSFLTAQSRGLIASLPEPLTTDYATGQFTYLPLIPNPSKILCVGLNYQDHLLETGRNKPTTPPSSPVSPTPSPATNPHAPPRRLLLLRLRRRARRHHRQARLPRP